MEPRSVEELAAIVRTSAHVRGVGAAHSWSPAIVTDDTLVSLDRMRGVIALDRERMQVTVQGGMRLSELNAYLATKALALANLGSIDSQSVAGVIATGTHGTGRAWQALGSQVRRLELIDGRGENVVVEGPDLAGAIVHLGALGIVHAVTFAVVEAFQLHDVTGVAPLDDVIDRIDEISASADHVKLWWLVPDERAIVFRFRRTSEPANDSALRRWFKDRVIAVAAYRSLLVVGHLSRRRLIPHINRLLTSEAGRTLDRIVVSHIGFLTPVPPVHAEAEWAFDVTHARELLREYTRVMTAGEHSYNFIQELRFTRADDMWLSPSYGRDSIWLSLYNIDRRGWPAQLARFEHFARAHDGRPHWGKEATIDRAYLRRSFERLDDFDALTRRFDPEGKFRNAWLDAILGPRA